MTEGGPDAIRFRLARNTPTDAQQFCALSNSLYGRAVDPAYYAWQFFECPFPSHLVVAVDQSERVVGTHGLHLQQGQPGGLLLAWVLDVMVAPSFQRQGLFRRLAAYGQELLRPLGVAATVIMANAKADRACVDGLGWTRINTLVTFNAAPGDGPPVDGSLVVTRGAGLPPAAQMEGVTRLVPTATRLFHNARTTAYQRWRFLLNPRYSYDVLWGQRRGGGVYGYVVTKVFQEPGTGRRYGDIVDVGWEEDDVDRLTALLAGGMAHLSAQGVESIAMWLQSNTVLDVAGARCGFTPSGQQRFFCGIVADDRFAWLEDPIRWFLTMADSEVY